MRSDSPAWRSRRIFFAMETKICIPSQRLSWKGNVQITEKHNGTFDRAQESTPTQWLTKALQHNSELEAQITGVVDMELLLQHRPSPGVRGFWLLGHIIYSNTRPSRAE
jgi:hypothetical protein